MDSTAQRSVLVVQRSSNLDGSAFSGLLLADGLREAGWETHVAFGFDGPIIEKYEAAGHHVYTAPHDNWLRRSRTPQFMKDVWVEWQRASDLEPLLSEAGPDVVYLNTVVSLTGAVAARRAGCQCVWHLREMFADAGGEMHAPEWATPLVRRIICHYADQVVANSRATARNLLGPDANRAVTIPNAVRSSFFDETRSPREARRALDIADAGIVIGVPGTIRPMKGHSFFIRAIAPLLRNRNDVHVAITGGTEGDYAAQVRAQVQRLGVGDEVQFVGWTRDMPGFYRACDVICIPSRAEPFGRTVIEAFAVGTPVVATAVGGIRETVDPETTGLLVPYGEDEALRASLQRLLDAPELRQKMSANARQAAEEEYHERVYKGRIAALIEEVASQRQKPSPVA